MAALSPNPQNHHSLSPLSDCSVCGCHEVEVDYVENYVEDYVNDGSQGTELELGECPRCEHRWTRSVRRPSRRRARSAAPVRLLPSPIESIPNAA